MQDLPIFDRAALSWQKKLINNQNLKQARNPQR
ncbi:hypothetical protein V6x_22060 [Gimesia chilikensis]|uniref:Uncharacterized protein n=1 Tax=Gimesia chilikensis TaxID=2605989 RepID=A0A517WB63_9PLAN|nr:hypothetical protein V6x_22060 [Gimesia chilikensis]